MAEWSIAAVLKTAVPRGTGGSNPSLSARRPKVGGTPAKPAPFAKEERLPSSRRGEMAAIPGMERGEIWKFGPHLEKKREKFWRQRKKPYLCIALGKARAFSAAGSEHLPYKQRVGGSNPSTPTHPTAPRCRGVFRFMAHPASAAAPRKAGEVPVAAALSPPIVPRRDGFRAWPPASKPEFPAPPHREGGTCGHIRAIPPAHAKARAPGCAQWAGMAHCHSVPANPAACRGTNLRFERQPMKKRRFLKRWRARVPSVTDQEQRGKTHKNAHFQAKCAADGEKCAKKGEMRKKT